MTCKLRGEIVPGIAQEVVNQLDGDIGLEEANDLAGAGVGRLLDMDIPREQLYTRAILRLWIVTYQI